ncbi:MAG: 8-amino-7-oxononanoate synthase [Polyangiales bacterium]|jgi:8-amino-7-oxononanoate synthase
MGHKGYVTLDETLAAELEDLTRLGLRRELLTLAAPGPVQELAGHTVVSFASNDYLGLGAEPLDLVAPVGALASRLVVGNLSVHEELEQALAGFVGAGAALLFTSGFAANVGVIPALVGPGDIIFSDQLNHASLIDGARLSGARIVVYPHNDVELLRIAMEQERPGRARALVLSEAVFSMDGDIADVVGLSELCRAQDTWLYVDEAHSLGLLGENGAGLCADKGVVPDVLLGTLGKSFATQGAFVAGSTILREWLIHRARSFVFSTGLSPYVSRATLERLVQVQKNDAGREQALRLADHLRSSLRAKGLEVKGEGAAISSVVIGEAAAASNAAELLLEAGYLARAIRPPTVPKGTSRIRIVTSAAHSDAQVAGLIEALGAILCS